MTKRLHSFTLPHFRLDETVPECEIMCPMSEGDGGAALGLEL